MGSSSDKPWTVQWHVLADGTVIHQRSKSDRPEQQLFQQWETSRPVTVDGLTAMDEQLERFSTTWARASSALLWGGGALCIAVTAVLFVTMGLAAALIGFFAVFVIIFLAGGWMAGHVPRASRRVFADAGIGSPVTMAATDARIRIAEPGTSSSAPRKAATA